MKSTINQPENIWLWKVHHKTASQTVSLSSRDNGELSISLRVGSSLFNVMVIRDGGGSAGQFEANNAVSVATTPKFVYIP